MQLKGIDTSFVDVSGSEKHVTEDNIKQLINHMGFDAEDESSLVEHYQQQELSHWLSLLPPVSVFQQSSFYQLEVHLPIDFVTDALVYRVNTECGKTIEEEVIATDFELLACNEISDVEFQLYDVLLSMQLDVGYHQLSLLEKGNEEPLATMSLIITPNECYSPTNIQKSNKLKGSNISLSQLKSGNNWGIGDFSDLNALLIKSAVAGDDYIHVEHDELHTNNPALFQYSSRRWLNILNIDITVISELQSCATLQSKLSSVDWKHKLNRLRESQEVDYIGVSKLKIIALRTLFQSFINETARDEQRYVAFTEFVKKQGDALKKKATYDALQYAFHSQETKQQDWSQTFQSYDCESTQQWCKDNTEEILFWSYCYWIAEEQLERSAELADSLAIKIGLSQALSTGVSKESVDLWADHDLYHEKINVGFVPSSLAEQGGLTEFVALSPNTLYKTAYRSFIKLLQMKMCHHGMLHIEQISELLRVWWVPDGESPTTGAYAYYNVYDLLNILALESQRNQCLVVSNSSNIIELPEGMDELLNEMNIYEQESLLS